MAQRQQTRYQLKHLHIRLLLEILMGFLALFPSTYACRGGQSAASNCRFEAFVTVHSLSQGGASSATRQLRQVRGTVISHTSSDPPLPRSQTLFS